MRNAFRACAMRNAFGACLWVLAAVAVSGLSAQAALPKGAEDYREGWRIFATPKAGPDQKVTLESRVTARKAAVPKLEAAVSADPTSLKYRTALVYVLLSASEYEKAKTQVDAAIKRERRDPLLYLLRAQAEAALAQMDPAKASNNIGPAITALDRAAELDPTNSLPLLQAVSIALDLDRLDLALPRLERALKLSDCRLYSLSVPFDLDPRPAVAVNLWQQIQFTYWFDLLARCQNAARGVIRLGDQEVKTGDLEAAESRYQQAREIGRRVGRAKPYLFLTVGTAVDILDPAYQRLAAIAQGQADAAGRRAEEAKKAGQDSAAFDQEAARWKHEAEKWNGERGVLRFGASQLQEALGSYRQQLAGNPPPSIETLTHLEAQWLTSIMAGIGLDPEKVPPGAPQAPAGKPAAATPRPAGKS
jgi:tetratricopeptide (TPR) repeat protein